MQSQEFAMAWMDKVRDDPQQGDRLLDEALSDAHRAAEIEQSETEGKEERP